MARLYSCRAPPPPPPQRHYASLTKPQQESLLQQLSQIDPAAVLERYLRTTATSKAELTGAVEPCTPTRLDLSSAEEVRAWEDAGYDAISKGRVGVILLAGGQGTRLGFEPPKGCFPGALRWCCSACVVFVLRFIALGLFRRGFCCVVALLAFAARRGCTTPLCRRCHRRRFAWLWLWLRMSLASDPRSRVFPCPAPSLPVCVWSGVAWRGVV